MINLSFAVIKRGSRGEGLMGCMQCILMHLQSISFSIAITFLILELKILCIWKNSVFSFLFHFGIVTYMVMLLNQSSGDFLFTISVDDMALTHDSDTKKLLNVLDFYVGIKILQHLADFKTCLRHV